MPSVIGFDNVGDMDVGTLIATCRARAGLSQRELAARAGTSAAAICLYESGERVPRLDTLDRIVSATGAALHIEVQHPEKIDLEANARALEKLLDLADRLPQRTESDEIEAPPFHVLAAGSLPDDGDA